MQLINCYSLFGSMWDNNFSLYHLRVQPHLLQNPDPSGLVLAQLGDVDISLKPHLLQNFDPSGRTREMMVWNIG
jgi:hypothetical protein